MYRSQRRNHKAKDKTKASTRRAEASTFKAKSTGPKVKAKAIYTNYIHKFGLEAPWRQGLYSKTTSTRSSMIVQQ